VGEISDRLVARARQQNATGGLLHLEAGHSTAGMISRCPT